jgi:hypothetical protein
MGIFTGNMDQVRDHYTALSECGDLIETRFFQYCSPSVPIQRAVLHIAKIMLAKLSLIVQYPLFHNNPTSNDVSEELRKTLYNISCEIIQWSHAEIHDRETSSWSWLLQTYVHWHPVAYLLNYLCTNPEPYENSRAWDAVEIAIHDPHGLSPEGNLAIWNPLRSLYSKAKAASSTSGDILGNPSMSALEVSADAAGSTPALDLPTITQEEEKDSLSLLDFRPFTTLDDFVMETTDLQGDFDWWSENSPGEVIDYNSFDFPE